LNFALQEQFKGSVEFKNVDFIYEGRDVKVFDGLNLSIPPHAIIGVVGASGSGKSTLASLLFR
jgi:ABC-type multidrug transport system fused ATPase/permease subunit